MSNHNNTLSLIVNNPSEYQNAFMNRLGRTAVHSQLQVLYELKVQSPPICCSVDSYRFFMHVWDKQLINLQEQVYIIFLNTGNEVISWRCLNTGTGIKTDFDLKLALACALSCMATKIIIAHNHPSGILNPSKDDIIMTKKLVAAASILDITLADHIIVTRSNYFSFIDSELL